MRVFPRLFGGVYVALMILLGASHFSADAGNLPAAAAQVPSVAQKPGILPTNPSQTVPSDVALQPGE